MIKKKRKINRTREAIKKERERRIDGTKQNTQERERERESKQGITMCYGLRCGIIQPISSKSQHGCLRANVGTRWLNNPNVIYYQQ
jgi:hypothetical protein